MLRRGSARPPYGTGSPSCEGLPCTSPWAPDMRAPRPALRGAARAHWKGQLPQGRRGAEWGPPAASRPRGAGSCRGSPVLTPQTPLSVLVENWKSHCRSSGFRKSEVRKSPSLLNDIVCFKETNVSILACPRHIRPSLTKRQPMEVRGIMELVLF